MVALVSAGAPAEPRSSAGRAAHPSAFFDARTFTLSRLRMPPLRAAPDARGLIVPHHWLAGHLILAGLRDLGSGRRLNRVVLLAPNHIGAGGALVTTSHRPWQTPMGRVDPDEEAIHSLVEAGLATLAPDWLTHEHSIGGLMPAFASQLPGIRVVPLAVHSGLRVHEVGVMALALSRLADDGTAFVAAVDFSHYLPPEEARIRDRETLSVLRNLDPAAVLAFSNDHLDSPGSIAVLVETMRLLGATRFELRANTNSAELVGKSPAGVTSYIFALYR
jgi:AmmeMemoRadiSam system protein B